MRYCVFLSMIFLASCAVFKGTSKVNKETKALIGTSWTLDLLADFEKEKTQEPISIMFYEDGKISGNGGCNRYGAQYLVSGDSISFSKIFSTKMACMPGMKTENKFFEALRNTNEYLLTNESLLLKKDGKVLASLSKVKKDK